MTVPLATPPAKTVSLPPLTNTVPIKVLLAKPPLEISSKPLMGIVVLTAVPPLYT
jgi:hypothetical protein